MKKIQSLSIAAGKENCAGAYKDFKKFRHGKDPDWLCDLREGAAHALESAGFPTTKNEHWRYTDVSRILGTPFHFDLEPRPAEISIERIQPFLFGKEDWPRLVFVNGSYHENLSLLPEQHWGIVVMKLSDAIKFQTDLVINICGQPANQPQEAFTNLNTAFFHEGVLIYVPEDITIEKPIHLIYLMTDPCDQVMVQPRNLILIGPRSRMSVLESYVSDSGAAYFNNAVTEIRLEEKAALNYYKQVNEGARSFHIGRTRVSQARASVFDANIVTLQGRLVRQDLSVHLGEESAQCGLDGLYFASGENQVDYHVTVDHAKPFGTSRQLFKGVLEGKSKAVFNGKIFVRRGAQKTDAEQTNKNLLLSEEAAAFTRPQLAIDADDVKCAHGAAVGQLDEGEVFYLKSRGLGEAKARSLLTYGFVSEIISRIPMEPVRHELDRYWMNKLEAPVSAGV